MLSIPLPSGLFGPDRYLLLAPRWADLGLAPQVVLVLLAFFVPLALVLWLYRYELRLASGHHARWLMLLRVVAVVVLVALVALRPVFAHVTREELPGRVIVAVDVSDSMDVRDPQRDPVDKLRLAKALKLYGGLCSGAQLDDWIEQHAAGRSVEWVKPDEFGDDSARRRKERDERRKAHDEVCKRVDALTRSQAARQLLADDGVRLLARLASKHHLELLAFSGDAHDAKPDQLDALLGERRGVSSHKTPVDVPAGSRPAAPRTAATDVGAPLGRAVERSGDDRGRVLGVVLLSDGQHNAGESPVKRAQGLKDQNVPLYPIALGAKKPPVDVAVLATTAPPVAFKDVDVPVKVRFKAVGLAAQELTVKVHRPGEEDQPLDQRTVQHDGKDQEYVESFQVRLDREGRQTLVVTAHPQDRSVKEAREENNRQPAAINVADEKSKVLLVDGEARWEFHYLATVLQRDRAMQPSSVVFLQPRLGKIPEDELKKIGNPSTTMPEGPDALAGYDCIILGDTSPEQFSLAERQRLEKYVADRGGTLVMLAGKRFMPLGFPLQPAEGRPEADLDPIQKLMPIEQPRVVAPLQGFPVSLTEEGRLTTFLQMDEAAEESETRWGELPPHYWGVVGKAKPGATTLAFYEAPEHAKLKGDKKVESEKANSLVVRHNYGFGRVLFVGLDSTWRWRYKVGDTYHHRFWSQAIRWAASDKPLIAGNDWVRFGTPEPVYRQGQAVDVVVRLAEELRPLGPEAAAGARILRQAPGGKDEAVALVPLARRESQPRVLEGQVRDLSAGQYSVELVIPELADRLTAPPGPDGQPGKLRAGFTVSGPEGEETTELATNWPLLEELASKSGGKVFSAENAGELVALLQEKGATKTEHWEFRLWQSWGTLLLFLVLLTVEWVSRKLAGLP